MALHGSRKETIHLNPLQGLSAVPAHGTRLIRAFIPTAVDLQSYSRRAGRLSTAAVWVGGVLRHYRLRRDTSGAHFRATAPINTGLREAPCGGYSTPTRRRHRRDGAES